MTLKISWESLAGGPDDDREDGPDGEAPRMRNPVFPRSIRRRNWRPSRGTSSSISASLGMCSMSCLPRTSMWTSAWCRPPRSGTTTPWSPWAWAHRMNVPEALAEYKLERAELAIALPRNWKLKHEDLKNERWYWPIRLLKTLARLPIASDTWLGFGHTMDNEEDFAENTKLCAAILTPPGDGGRQRGLHPAGRRGGQLLPGAPPLPGRAGVQTGPRRGPCWIK